MLQSATVDAGTLGLLNKIMSDSEFDSFNLVGGTALALQIGHRKSIDLDLFTPEEFNSDNLLYSLNKYGQVAENFTAKNTLGVFINDIKVDLIRYPFDLIRPLQIDSGVRMYAIEDIGAMKLRAIAKRGAKKYFWDLFFY